MAFGDVVGHDFQGKAILDSGIRPSLQWVLDHTPTEPDVNGLRACRDVECSDWVTTPDGIFVKHHHRVEC